MAFVGRSMLTMALVRLATLKTINPLEKLSNLTNKVKLLKKVSLMAISWSQKARSRTSTRTKSPAQSVAPPKTKWKLLTSSCTRREQDSCKKRIGETTHRWKRTYSSSSKPTWKNSISLSYPTPHLISRTNLPITCIIPIDRGKTSV